MDLSYVVVVLMVCLTLGFVLNAFELKLFDSLFVAKKLHENVHLASFTIAMQTERFLAAAFWTQS